MPRILLATALFVASVAGGVSLSASAQETSAERAFDWTLGTWEGVRRDAASGDEAEMTMRVERLMGGDGQLRTMEIGGENGSSYRGTAVQRADPSSGRWV